MLVHYKKIIQPAYNKNRGLGAFNTYNLEITQAIVRAVKELKKSAIIQVSENTLKYAGVEAIAVLVNGVVQSENLKTPIALHLDHGRDLAIIEACLAVGFSSVHIDASEFAFKENVALTKKVVRKAHQQGILVQGELGYILGRQDIQKKEKGLLPPRDFMTDPAKAREFVKQTKVDTLAISIGSAHGYFKGQEKLDFKRLQEIRKLVKVPLVLHGASGVSARDLKRAVQEGMTIFNFNTELIMAFSKAVKKNLKRGPDPRKYLGPASRAVSKIVAQKINFLA